MKKQLLLGILGSCIFTGQAQTFKEWQDAEINAINRAPMHANFFAYENTDAATKAVKEKSANYMSSMVPGNFSGSKMQMHVLPISGKQASMTKVGTTCRFLPYGN